MADGDAFRIANVEGTAGKELHDHEVFGGTGAECDIRGKFEPCGAGDCGLLEG